jgi:hypothetical protein
MSWFVACLLLSGIATGLLAQPAGGTLLWSYNPGSTIATSPAIAPDGTIYIGSYAGLFAITNAGSNKWTIPSPVASSPAIGSDGTIYFGDGYTNFSAINPDGSQKWTYPLQGVKSCPAIGPDNTIYVAAGAQLFALTPAGTKKWALITDSSEYSACSAVIGPDGTIYFGNTTFYAINPDGTIKWSLPFAGFSGDSAAVGADGTIYVGNGPLYALNPDGTGLWTNTAVDFAGCSPVVGGTGVIYLAGNIERGLHAVSPAGEVLWNATDAFAWHTPPPPSPAVDAGGMIYYAWSDILYAVTPQGGIQWSYRSPGYYALNSPFVTQFSPAIGPDGTIYATFLSGVYALKGTNGLGNAPWPMYHQNLRHTGKVERPSLQKGKKRADANFEFQLYGEVGQSYTIQRSSDLSLWSSLTNLVATNPPATFVDLTASNFTSRFYRAVSQ